MNLETMLIVAAVVAAVGTISTQLFRGSDAPYLVTITGTRLQLIVCGALIWLAAIAIGLIALVTVSMFMSSMVAIAIFFGIEAVALDICAHRTHYRRIETPQPGRVRVSTLNRY